MAVFPFICTSIISLFVFFSVSSAVDDSISSFQSIRDGQTLVSSGGRFELGFFSPGNSKNRYLGIWYKNIPVQTVVWVANRCNPIRNSSSGSLSINNTGSRVILYHNKSVVWSTRSFKDAQKPILRLLDTGNLVLVNNISRSFLWQSFDYPSDTLIAGMKLGLDFQRRINWSLSAWKSSNDPCPGNLSYGLELQRNNTSPEIFMRKGTAKYYRSGPWNGIRFSGAPDLTSNGLFNFTLVKNNDELYYLFELKLGMFARVVLNESISMRLLYICLPDNPTCRLLTSAPRDDCDKYGLCGANATCDMSQNITTCHCLQGFKPASQKKWDLSDWSEGCVRNKPLSCLHKDTDGFVKLVDLKLPDTTNSWVNQSLNLQECKAKCLRNCSCVAYTNSNISGEGSGCIMWFGDLLDVRQLSTNGQNLYIRMSASELGKVGNKRRVMIVASVVGSISVMLLVGFCIYRRRCLKGARERKRHFSEERDDLELPLFDLATITNATDNFSDDNKLGQGGFGPVYKGTLEDGKEIAVKRLSSSSGQGLNEFKNEVILFSKLQHRNLVRLLGCCIEGEEKLLIYEYLPNKSLNFFIFDETRKKLLDWSKRFQIICGIARGLLYLHQDSRLRIIHRDLKAGNVLLDNELNPKIADFGMAKMFGENQTEGNTNRVVGTYGYMAPEYASDGLFSIKSDVFSFGIMVLEIISGKKNRGFFHPDHSLNLAGHAWRLWKAGNGSEMIDECLVGLCDVSQVLRCIHISLLCVQQRPEDRPSMPSVTLMLGGQGSLPQPKQPGFFIEKVSFNHTIACSNIQESTSANKVTITMLEPR